MKYIMSIDQGTTSTRVILVDHHGDVKYIEQMEITQIYPFDGAVLQNALEIYDSVITLIDRIIKRNSINPNNILSIGITNQRETTVMFDKKTGLPLDLAISWQSLQTEAITKSWIEKKYSEKVYDKTGLKISPYFSASKIRYLIDQTNPNLDEVLFGTIDTYLLYRMTKQKSFKTDVTNASRTMLFNIHTLSWDEELLDLFGIKKELLPKVYPNSHLFGYFEYEGVSIPINSMIGDQQSALFGHQCFKIGETKNTYGTGCFMLMNTGNHIYKSEKGLLSTIAWQIGSETTYALEGSVFMGGAAVKWMRDKLNIIDDANETELLAMNSKDDTLYVVPAYVGLGAPYWDSNARGTMFGLKMHTTKADIAKATLNSIAYQVNDLLETIKLETGISPVFIAVDGGASRNNYLMQFQSSISQSKLIQTAEAEITALGAAYLAGLSIGFWNNFDEINKNKKLKNIFYPSIDEQTAKNYYDKWKLAVELTRKFR